MTTLQIPSLYLTYNYFPNPLSKNTWSKGKVPSSSAGSWFQSLMVPFKNEHFPISVFYFLPLTSQSWSPLLRQHGSCHLSPIAFVPLLSSLGSVGLIFCLLHLYLLLYWRSFRCLGNCAASIFRVTVIQIDVEAVERRECVCCIRRFEGLLATQNCERRKRVWNCCLANGRWKSLTLKTGVVRWSEKCQTDLYHAAWRPYSCHGSVKHVTKTVHQVYSSRNRISAPVTTL